MSCRRRAVALVVLVACVSLLPGVAAGDEVSDKRAEAERVASRVAELNREIEVEAEAYNAARIELDRLNAAIADAEAKVAATQAELVTRRAEVQAYAVGAYVRGGEGFDVDAVFNSDVSDLGRVRSYLSAATGNREQLIDALRSAEEDLHGQVSTLEASKADAEAKAAELDANRRRAESAAAEQRELLAQVQGELAELVRQEQARQAAAAQAAAEARAREAAARAPTTRTGSGSTGGGTTPAPAPNGGAATAVAAARAQIGDPYVWGADGPDSFDCSGLTMYAWAQAGVSLPHNSAMQYSATQHISISEIQPGDLVFYGWSSIHHVAIYVGGGRIVHAPHAGDVVREDSLYYWDDLRGVGRVTG
jgi:cell wall-associated NlpC family hydrolase